MTENELNERLDKQDAEELAEMEKNFGTEVARKMLALGYTKYYSLPRCERCGRRLSIDPYVYDTPIMLDEKNISEIGNGKGEYDAKLCPACVKDLNREIATAYRNFFLTFLFKREDEQTDKK